MPTKIYRIKINDFWINVSYSPPHYPRQKKQRNRKCQKLDKCLQITTSPFSKITETAPFPPSRLSDISIAIHSNSIAGYVIMFTIGVLYRKPIVNMITDPAIEFEWIAIEMSESLCGWKGSSFCDFEIGLVVIWRRLSHFWHFRFLCFLAWVMRRTVANINPKVIHFDAVDFNGHHSKKL